MISRYFLFLKSFTSVEVIESLNKKKLSMHCDITIPPRSHQLDIYWQLTLYYNLRSLIAPELLENSIFVKKHCDVIMESRLLRADLLL